MCCVRGKFGMYSFCSHQQRLCKANGMYMPAACLGVWGAEGQMCKEVDVGLTDLVFWGCCADNANGRDSWAQDAGRDKGADPCQWLPQGAEELGARRGLCGAE